MTTSLSLVAAFLRRDWAISRSYRFDFAFGAVESLVSLVLFFYLSDIIDQSKVASDSQLSQGYFAFAVVGLALIRVLQTGVTSFAFQLREDQMTGTLEALLVTPAPQALVVLGSATYEVLRAAFSAVLMLIMAIALFGLDLSIDASSALTLLVAMPASFALFTALGIAVAAFTVVFKQTVAVVSFASTAVTVFAGVYFPVSLFPPPLETFANALPFTWAVDVFRSALLGGTVSTVKVVLLVVCGAVAVPLSIALFRSAVDFAKQQGSLAQY